MPIPAIFMLIIGAMFAVASFTCLLERQPFLAGVMAFTAILTVGSVAMAVA